MVESEETWLLIEADGRFHQVHAPKGKAPHNPDKLEALRVAHHTRDPLCETYDRKTGRWVRDDAKRAREDEAARRLTISAADVYAELEPRLAALEAALSELRRSGK